MHDMSLCQHDSSSLRRCTHLSEQLVKEDPSRFVDGKVAVHQLDKKDATTIRRQATQSMGAGGRHKRGRHDRGTSART